VSTPALTLERVAFAYGRTPVLTGLDLAIAEGSITGLLGPNGSGKTTLVRLASAALRPASGRIALFGDDLGAQNCPQISPRMYREFFKPRHQLLWNHAKKLAPVKVMLHCCGAVRQLLPDLIEAGLDAINPVQVSCRGMGAAGLKTDFGSELTFWGGGCDTQQMLPEATPDQVRAHVLGQLEILSKGGGFVFQQVHNILGNVPVENVIAMYGAVREFNQRTS